MDLTLVGIIGIVVLVLIFLTRIPIAFAMAIVGFVGFGLLVTFKAGMELIAIDVIDSFASYSFSVIPLFILMGNIAYNAGISRRLYYAAYTWLGHLRGGLAMATIGGCAAFAAVCGSLTATVATMGTVALPEMRSYKYDKGLATGCIAAGGTLGVLIPPSVIFILYGIQTEQSIGRLFVAGVFPGIMLAGFFIATIYLLCRRNPSLGPAGPTTSLKEKLASFSGTIEMLALFILVIGGLFVGLFTPTEAGAVGAFGAIIIGLVRRQLQWQGIVSAIKETLKTTCMVFLLLLGVTVFGHFLTVTQIPTALADWMGDLPVPPVIVMIGMLAIYLLGGCFMGGLAFMILTVPIFYPIVLALGFDPIWFGVLMVIMVEIGSITPPVGISVYIITGIAKDVPLEAAFKGIFPFLIAFAICVAILIAFPQIALFLPGLMG